MNTAAATRATRWARALTLGIGIGLTAAALALPAAASADIWSGFWRIHPEGQDPGKMCLKKDGSDVGGKFQSSNPNKHGVISGSLSNRHTEWDGHYRDHGTGDHGPFHAEQGELGRFEGWFKSHDTGTRYSWSGHLADPDIGYHHCVRKHL